MMDSFMEYFPEIIQPFMFGMIFVYIFTAVANLSSKDNMQTRWIIYYIVGYFIQLIALPIRCYIEGLLQCIFYDWFYVVAVCVISVVIAVCIGKLFNSKWFKNMRNKIGIAGTLRNDYWVDIYDLQLGTYVRCIYPDGSYISGMITYMEQGVRYPQIALYMCDINGNKCDDGMLVSVDTQKCKCVLMVYDVNSKVLPTVKDSDK